MTNKSGQFISFGQVWTPAQWNIAFAQFGDKVDAAGGSADRLDVTNGTLEDATATNLTVNGGVLHDVTIFTKPGSGGVFREGSTKYIGIVITSRPAAGQVFYISIPFACVVPASLVGTTVYAGTSASNDSVFALNRVTAGNVVSPLGTITITNASHFAALTAGSGGGLGVGDALQIVCPSPADSTLADIALTIVAARV